MTGQDLFQVPFATARRLGGRPHQPPACTPLPGISGSGDLPCAGQPDLFFSQRAREVQAAKELCGSCCARTACLAAAIERREPWGVWGGETLRRGKRVPGKAIPE
jgi:WhiB family redox-sensing transcriptional regulator